jgi:hypothetical protein
MSLQTALGAGPQTPNFFKEKMIGTLSTPLNQMGLKGARPFPLSAQDIPLRLYSLLRHADFFRHDGFQRIEQQDDDDGC